MRQEREKGDVTTREANRSFKVGDKIQLSDSVNQARRENKNTNRRRNHFVITRKFSENLFEIKGEGQTMKIIHFEGHASMKHDDAYPQKLKSKIMNYSCDRRL